MFVFLFSLLVLHCALASPVEQLPQPTENREWLPSRMAYARDFDRWFDWVPWGSSDAKRSLSVKDRIQIVETRQQVLFDLVRCESYGQSDCSPFRTQAETVFEVPTREQAVTAPTKVLPGVTPAISQEQSTAASSAAPAASSAAPIASTAASVATTAAPVQNSTPAPTNTVTPAESSSPQATTAAASTSG